MATASSALPPPPSPGDASAPQAAPTAPPSASPAPATPSPVLRQGTQMMLEIVNQLRTLAKTFPGAGPAVAEINEIIRGKITPAIMQHAEPGEPAAPPTGA